MRLLATVCACLAAVACSDDTNNPKYLDLAVADQASEQPAPDAGPDGPSADTTQPDGPSADTTQPDGPSADTTQPDGPSADATQPDATPADLGGLCNNLVNTAAVIQEQAGSGAPPTLNGGSIVEGTYHRTQTIYYSSPKSRYIKETIKLTKTAASVYKMEFVSATSPTSPPAPEYHVNVELTLTGGANVNYNIVCGTTGAIPTTYEASATSFRIRLGPADLIYTLQP